MPRSLLEHLGPIALGVGIVPFVLGGAWLLIPLLRERTREQHAFASIAIVTFVALLLEVTSYDLRFGFGRLHLTFARLGSQFCPSLPFCFSALTAGCALPCGV